MIIVIGEAKGRPETIKAMTALAYEHTERSRDEPGCISHDVAVDAGYPLRLVFTERWESREALQAHFRVQASGEFVKRLRELTAELPSMEIYEAEQIIRP